MALSESNDEALDKALDAGADIKDINNIRARAGLSQLQEVASSKAPVDKASKLREGTTIEPTGGVGDVPTEAPVSSPEVAVEEPIVSATAEEYVDETAPESTEEVYLDPPLPLEQDATKKRIALDQAALASAEGKEPRSVYEEHMAEANDPDMLTKELLNNTRKAIDKTDSAVDMALSDGVEIDGTAIAGKIATMVGMSEEGGALANAAAYVEALPVSSLLSPDEKSDVVFNQYLRNIAAEVVDDMGWKDWVGDISGYLVPQENLRLADAAQLMGVNFEEGDYIDYTDFLSRTASKLRDLPDETRFKMIDTLVEGWPEIHGDNRLALADFLQVLTGEFSEDWRHVENAFERVDQFGLGVLTPIALVRGIFKATSAMRIAVKAGNIEGAADIAQAAAKGELAGNGVTPLEGVTSMLPVEGLDVLVKGADSSQAEGIRKVMAENSAFLDEVDSVNSFGLVLTEQEKAYGKAQAVREILAEPGMSNIRVEKTGDNTFDVTYETEELINGKFQLEEYVINAEARDLDDKTFSIAYDVEDETGTIRETVTKSYQIDSIKGSSETGAAFKAEGTDGFTGPIGLNTVLSPKAKFWKDSDILVALPEQMGMKGAKIKGLFQGAVDNTLGKLNAQSVKKLGHVLTAGDDQQKVFSYAEAVLSKEGVNGVKLTPQEFEGYVGMRQIMDKLHAVKNKEIVETWRAQGVKMLDWFDGTVPVKDYSSPEGAVTAFNQSVTKSKHIAVEGADDAFKTVDGSKVDVQTLIQDKYAQGYRLAKVKEGKFIPSGDTNVEWVLVKGEKFSEPSGLVLSKREGYMPKIRTDAHYFLKQTVMTKVGDGEFPMEKTVRYFDNKADADAYKLQVDPDGVAGFTVKADREFTPSQLADEYVNISGGLFTGGRKSEDIPFGLDGAKGKRMDSLTAMQRYIENIARTTPMNLYRIGVEARWIQHAKDVGAISKNYTGSFSSALDEGVMNANHATAGFLKESHDQISFVNGIPTQAEKAMDIKLRSLANGLDDIKVFGKKPFAALARNLHDTSIEGMTGNMRGAAFHLMLGMYNPAQLLIQASGSLVALSVNPLHGGKGIGQTLGYAVADLATGNPVARKKYIQAMRDKGIDMDGYELWEKSGMRENVVNSNLDYSSLWSDRPYDAGVFRKLLGNGDLFFKSGELFNSRVSFATAYNWFKAENNGRKITDADLPAILTRAEEYRLNMTRANSAKFQTGLSSVPLQFQQVNTKFLEKLFAKGSFTGQERGRLAAGQVALFGTAGVPLVGSFMPILLDAAGVNYDSLEPEQLNKVRNGTLAWFLQDQMGVENVITGRMTLGSDIVENAFNIFYGSVNLEEVALGPFSSVWDKLNPTPLLPGVHGSSNNFFEKVMTITSTVTNGEDFSIAEHAQVAKLLAESVLQIPSSGSNLVRANYMFHSQFYKNKNGKSIFEWGDKNLQTVITSGLGFAPQETQDWFELSMTPGGVSPSEKKIEAKRIAWFLSRMEDTSDATQQKMLGAAINAISRSHPKGDDRMEIWEHVHNILKDPTDSWEQLLKTNVEAAESDLRDGLGEIAKLSKFRTNPNAAKRLQEMGIGKQ